MQRSQRLTRDKLTTSISIDLKENSLCLKHKHYENNLNNFCFIQRIEQKNEICQYVTKPLPTRNKFKERTSCVASSGVKTQFFSITICHNARKEYLGIDIIPSCCEQVKATSKFQLIMCKIYIYIYD